MHTASLEILVLATNERRSVTTRDQKHTTRYLIGSVNGGIGALAWTVCRTSLSQELPFPDHPRLTFRGCFKRKHFVINRPCPLKLN